MVWTQYLKSFMFTPQNKFFPGTTFFFFQNWLPLWLLVGKVHHNESYHWFCSSNCPIKRCTFCIHMWTTQNIVSIFFLNWNTYSGFKFEVPFLMCKDLKVHMKLFKYLIVYAKKNLTWYMWMYEEISVGHCFNITVSKTQFLSSSI